LYLLKVGVACCLLGAVLWVGAGAVDWLALRAQPWVRITWLAGVLMGAGVLYLAALAAMGVRRSAFRRSG
ncbi:MAG: lipid II flippase MurJ, partial [Betaproteobacteria bacterium]